MSSLPDPGRLVDRKLHATTALNPRILQVCRERGDPIMHRLRSPALQRVIASTYLLSCETNEPKLLGAARNLNALVSGLAIWALEMDAEAWGLGARSDIFSRLPPVNERFKEQAQTYPWARELLVISNEDDYWAGWGVAGGYFVPTRRRENVASPETMRALAMRLLPCYDPMVVSPRLPPVGDGVPVPLA